MANLPVLSRRDLSPRAVAWRHALAVAGFLDALPTWERLTPAQKNLWAPRTAKAFTDLPDVEKLTFALITQRMTAVGLDLKEVRVSADAGALQKNRLYLEPRYKDSLARFEKSIRDGIHRGALQKSGAFPLFHGKTTIAARENRKADVLHLGVGTVEVFIHMDEFNPRAGPMQFVLHAWELMQYAKGRRPEPSEIADRLDIEFFGS